MNAQNHGTAGPFAEGLTSDGRTFDEPWQAEAFALTVELHAAGVFSWQEWSRALGAQIAAFNERGEEDYFVCWLNALEGLLAAKEIASPEELRDLATAWGQAYRETPHGRPVVAPTTLSTPRDRMTISARGPAPIDQEET